MKENYIMLNFSNLLRSSKKTKGGTAGIGVSYANSSFDKSPLVNKYNANVNAASREGSLSAFTNNGAPRIPRATPVTRMDNLEMSSGYGRRNEGLAGRNAVSIPLCVCVQCISKEKDPEEIEKGRLTSMYVDCNWLINKYFFFPAADV